MGQKPATTDKKVTAILTPGGPQGGTKNIASAEDISGELCPACGKGAPGVAIASPVDYEYGVETGRPFCILGCRSCESQWLYPRPEVEELVAFYPPDYHAYHDDHGLIASLLVALRARLRARQYRDRLLARRCLWRAPSRQSYRSRRQYGRRCLCASCGQQALCGHLQRGRQSTTE